MQVIADIRLFKSKVPNTDGNSLPSDFSDKKLNAVIHRITMKLREHNFSLGDKIDHLYVNFTNCAVEGKIAPSRRSPDKYHHRYRYYDVEVSDATFEQLGTSSSTETILSLLEQVLLKYFVSERFDKEFIRSCVSEAVTQGEKMLMKFKEKSSSTGNAVIYLRYLDNCLYSPLLRVFDCGNNAILEADLPETIDLNYIGTIQLSAKKVTIKPRKNAYTKALEPLSFDLSTKKPPVQR